MLDRESLLQEFLEFSDEAVIVEGRKDWEALKSLGFSNVIQLHKNNSILEMVESLQDYHRVTILTDLDRQGKILRKKLLRYFNLYGISENEKPRLILAKMRVQHIESLKNRSGW